MIACRRASCKRWTRAVMGRVGMVYSCGPGMTCQSRLALPTSSDRTSNGMVCEVLGELEFATTEWGKGRHRQRCTIQRVNKDVEVSVILSAGILFDSIINSLDIVLKGRNTQRFSKLNHSSSSLVLCLCCNCHSLEYNSPLRFFPRFLVWLPLRFQ